jgi:hypothetical protein
LEEKSPLPVSILIRHLNHYKQNPGCRKWDAQQPYSLLGNAGLYLDKFLFGNNHLYNGEGIPFDPEGLLSTIPAIVNVVIGYYAGKFIQQVNYTFSCLVRKPLLFFTRSGQDKSCRKVEAFAPFLLICLGAKLVYFIARYIIKCLKNVHCSERYINCFMKYFKTSLTFFSLILMPCAWLHAQPIAPSILNKAWNAYWITVPNQPTKDYGVHN